MTPPFPNMQRGLFITLEGMDGVGKSTQARRLAQTLQAHGRTPILTREPGGAPGAEDIRTLLVTGAPNRWSPKAEILLFTAARHTHVEHTIRPALAAGHDVVCDRFVDSTRIYQGARHPDLPRLVDDLHTRLIKLDPDLTLILDMPPETASERGAGGPTTPEDRFETFGLAFHKTLRAGFRALAMANPDRCVVIDATHPPDVVASRIADMVLPRLKPTP